MTKLKSLTLEHLISGTLLLYVTVHLLEEGLFGFPAWANLRWGIPGYDFPKWLMHNGYFAAFLVAGYFLYRRNREKWLAAGVGIVVWGALNCLNHFVFTGLFLEYSPGLFTGFLFGLMAILAVQRLRDAQLLTWKFALAALGFGVLYWALPIGAFLAVDIGLGL
ncbi:MAG TPA: hypothetical protein PKH77_08645 [Anaerolineae bacterium]|nr:hypothetical protein [Anaerolineae bacterium]